jgi:NAD(P)-dependent dehydrogenase (short-subunit alcohol dehydrogenase family)
MDNRFADKVILLAGGTGALGQAISLAFLAELGKVAVTYRQPEEFAALQKAASAHSAQVEGHQVDVTDEAAVRQLIEAISTRYGRLDVLVNAVGAYAGAAPRPVVDGLP